MKRILLLSIVMLLGLYTTVFAEDCHTHLTSSDLDENITCLGEPSVCGGYSNWTWTYACHGTCIGSSCTWVSDPGALLMELNSDVIVESCSTPATCDIEWVESVYLDFICECV